MNLWVVEPLRKGPIGGNNCHNCPDTVPWSNQPDPEGGGAAGSVVVAGGVVVVGGEVVTPLLGGGVGVVSAVVEDGPGEVVTVGVDGGGAGSTSAGRVDGPEPEPGRTIPPMVVPWPPENCCPRANSSPVITSMPSRNASSPPASTGAHGRPERATLECMRW